MLLTCLPHDLNKCETTDQAVLLVIVLSLNETEGQ